jgi:hypothetical protein
VDVTKTKSPGNGHSIEIGKATWDNTEVSIRNRYPTSTGGFSPRSSSELPLDDVAELVTVVADEDLYDPKRLAELIELLAASIKRQT